MKKLFLGLIATVMITNLSFAQKSLCLKSSVTEKEFEEMDAVSQKIASYVDSAIFALEGMSLNKDDKNKVASIRISLKDSKLDNNILIGDTETTTPTENAQSCTICGLQSGRICFKRIVTQLNNGPLVITVEKISDCIKLTWDVN